MKTSRNPIVGELVRTDHPKLPIMDIDDRMELGYLATGKTFPKGNLGIVTDIRINMGKLVFEDGTTGWCNLCYLEVIE